MATQPRLVNKQFNTPIGLYSQQNINEVLEREQQILSNGAIGIDFQHSDAGKPSNLRNSAVLRMLEEEEYRQRSGRGGHDEYVPRPLQDLAWPPPEHDQKLRQLHSFKDVVIPGVKRVAWPPQEDEAPDSPYVQQSAAPTQGGPQFPAQKPGLQQNNYSQPASYQQQQQSRPLKPLDVNSVSSVSPLGSPLVNQTPAGFRPSTPSKRWAPVHSPTATPQYQEPGRQYFPQPQSQPVSQQYQTPASQQYQAAPSQNYQSPGQQYQAAPSQNYQSPGQQYQAAPSQQYYSPGQQPQAAPSQQYQAPSSHQQYQQPQYQSQSSQQSNPPQYFQPAAAQAQAAPRVQSSRQVEPPPSTITLRPQAPVSQAPPPVFSSQPATATLKGGKHLRGDLKWPPENVRQQMEEEKIHLLELAKGPACKPRKNCKDYTPFFEKHALNNSYPGYKIPPGTQYFRPV